MSYCYYITTPHEQFYVCQFYKRCGCFLRYQDTHFFERSLDFEKVTELCGQVYEHSQRINGIWDQNSLWFKSTYSFHVWRPRSLFWNNRQFRQGDVSFHYFYKKHYRLALEAIGQEIVVFGFCRKWVYCVNTNTILINWTNDKKGCSGLSIIQDQHETKIYSRWNIHVDSPWSSWVDPEDNWLWTKSIGKELADFLNVKWQDRLPNFILPDT
ncbi:MAG: hypothetical protein FWC50_13560 [Planctomycetaceae bacterium]|nr:hypothetical protein [Planctomycetaceae bacterium]